MSETPRTHGLHRQLMTVENIGPVESYKRMSILAETLEAELAAALAELAAMRSGEVVWAKPIEHEDVCQCPKCGVFHDKTGAPLYTAPAQQAVGLPEGCPETAHFRLFSGLHRPALLADQMSPICNDYSNCAPVEIHPVGTRARLAALTGLAKKGEG